MRHAHRINRPTLWRRLGVTAVAIAIGLGLPMAATVPASAADPTASMTINKASSASEITPGQQFNYTIQVQCTAGTVAGCLNAAITDTMPDGITIVGDPTVSGNGAGGGNATVTHDDTSFTATFTDSLAGGVPGFSAGVVITITVPVRLDPAYPPELSGTPLDNTAHITADNANPKESTAEVIPNVPPVLNAATTKDITQPGAVPEPGTPADATVTGTNTSNVPVDRLVISDPVDPTADPNPFDYLALTGLGNITLPDGAEAVRVRAFVGGSWVDGPLGPPGTLPAGVDPADVKGLQFVFISTAGAGITPGAVAGVAMDLEQTQAVVDAPKPLIITNSADTTVTLDDQSKTSPPASDTYRIPPSDVSVGASKSFDPDTVKAGDPSTVTLGATNTTDNELDSLTITEPGTGSTNPFTDGGLTFTGLGTDGAGAGIVWPRGATGATITYQCGGTAGAPQQTSTVNTLPAPPAGCDPVTGFTVTFDGPIAQGAEATIPFTVQTDEDQADETYTRSNTIDVTGTIGSIEGTANASDDITSITDRLAIEVSKKIHPAQIPSLPGQIATSALNGHLKPFPDSTTDAHQIVVQDPDPIAGDEWFAAFQPQSVTATAVPADSTLTVEYWNGTQWVSVPGMTNIAGPTIVNQELPDAVKENAQGLRFVYTSTLPEPEGFAPGTAVAPNFVSSLRPGMANSDATITNCAGSSASNGSITGAADPTACDDVQLIPIDPGTIDPIDKNWDKDLLNARSGQQSGITISWSTQGYTGLQKGTIADSADPDTTALPASVYDVFDLVRLDPITTAMDPVLTFDQITGVELYRLPAGSTDPAAGAWTDATNDLCPAACDGTFPGFNLTTAERADTIGFRFTYVESPTRVQRISGPGDPSVGTGIAASFGNNRRLHPVFQLRDELRSNNNVPITADRVYNISGEQGQIRNTVRATGWFDPDTDPTLTVTDADDIALIDVPVTVSANKTWSGGPLGLPAAGTPADQFPTSRVTISGKNTTPAKVDRLVITDPVGGSTPFESFNLTGFTAITDPGSIGATGLTVVLVGGSVCTEAAPCTRAQALALTEAQLTEVTGMTLTYTGRINAAATASATFDARLRPSLRTAETPTQTGRVANEVGVEAADLANYPAVEPKTADDDASASIEIQPQGIGVEATKSITPESITEPSNGPVTVTLQGQPTGPSRAVEMTLVDQSPTFFNAFDLQALSPVALTGPINRVKVDAYVGGTWSIGGDGKPVVSGGEWVPGNTVAGPAVTLPAGVTPAQVQGLRYTFSKADGSNWENPSHPIQKVGFTATRRDTLHTGGPVSTDLGTPAPGETVAGATSNTTTAGVTSSDRDVNNDPLTDTDDAAATVEYQHGQNAVQVRKGPNGEVNPGQPFTYTLTMKNTGAVDITNPVITDVFPADGQGPQVVFPDAGAVFSFAIAGGTGMPTDAAEVTVESSATGTKFSFPAGSTIPIGATYTIKFQMQTRPGLAANTKFTNSFGIVGDRPWDACDGTLNTASGECRATATNNVLSAGALSVTKQVKAEGSDVLGTTTDPAVDFDQPCVADSDGYYSRPCVPVAEPGGDVDWRLHFVNTGNRPIDRIVAVDRFPVPGDTLATDPDLKRGSQWRPLLEGPRPTLSQAGQTLNIWYSTATLPCTNDLGTDSVKCPDGSWTAWPAGQVLPVDPDTVTGVKLEILLDPMLAPAASIDVELQMVAPAFSPTAGADTITFNTIGMSGRWVNTTSSGTTKGYTLTTEPPRVGAALATGPLQIVKELAGDAADQYAPDSYTATLVCTSVGQDVPLTDAQKNLTLVPNEPVTVTDLPYHSACTVTEGDHGQTSWSSTTATVQRELTDVETVVLTNTYEYASLAVTKTVDSAAVDQDGTAISYGPFTVDISCQFLGGPVYGEGYSADTPMTAELTDGQTVRFDKLPAGASCTVTESDDKGAAGTEIVATIGSGDPETTDGAEATIELAPQSGDDAINAVAITNRFAAGPVTLTKIVTGDVADTYGAGPFALAMSCVLDDDSGSRTVWDDTVVLGGGQPLSKTVENIATGAECTVTEPDDAGASTVTISPDQPITVGDGDPVTVEVTNSFDPGTLLLTKKVTGDAASYAPKTFTAEVTCFADDKVLPGFPKSVAVTAGEQTEVATLVGATCSAIETETGSATGVSYVPAAAGADGSAAVDITGDDPAEIVIDNEYRAGGVRVVKDIAGPGAAIGAGPYGFAVQCAFNGNTKAYQGTVTLERSGTATTLTSDPITGLPAGAVCTITETDSGGADELPPPVTVTVPDVADGVAQVATAGFVNVYSAATVQLTKELTGTGAAAAKNKIFTVAVTCQVQASDGQRLGVYSGNARLRGGQTVVAKGADGKPVLLPLGAHCFAEETDNGGATATAVDHDSYDNAVVVERSDQVGTLAITVTNTFDAPTTPEATTGPSTPAPPTGTSPAGPPTDPPGPTDPGSAAPLPNTGVPVGQLLTYAALLVAGGLALLVMTRRRRGRHSAG
ncbi:DUF5979 domain-containing protein [Nakamurella lactea]|uniref:DUF5979 domain-containing protein n=1 Tax=Nakamurella lactea TaxID=459515 RepID=UPI00137760FA|nr:DUF5979 domain-containing protein [Nakamurella lactea]